MSLASVSPVQPDPRRPAWVEKVPTWLEGRTCTRMIFILRAVGCAYARRPEGGCRMCGFHPLATGKPVLAEDLVAQLEESLAQPGFLEGVEELDLYNSGSFFNDEEIPPQAREAILTRLSRTSLRRVLVESRPEYLSWEKVRRAKELLGNKILEIGIGLESANDRVREEEIRKGFNRADFEGGLDAIRRGGAQLLAYLLIKPPGLTELEAIEDAVASAAYVFQEARRRELPARVAFQPVFVAPGTALEREFQARNYQPPGLWSVLEVLRRSHPLGSVQVGLSDEGLDPHARPGACPLCSDRLQRSLRTYNQTQNSEALQITPCECESSGRIGR